MKPRPSIALPFNCADPGSAISEIVFNFARFPGPAESGIALTLLPYNTCDGEPRLERLVNRAAMMLARREGEIGDDRLFVAHVRRPLPAALLRHLFPSAILDGGDPEFAWVEARLEALGVPAVLHAGAGEQEEIVHLGRRFERFDDAQSPRLIETDKPSRTRCMELMSEAHALAGRPAPVSALAAPRPIDLRPILGGMA